MICPADPIPDWLAAFETWRAHQWREGWPDFDVPKGRKSPYISCVKVVEQLPQYAIDLVPLMERSVDGWWFLPLYSGPVLAWYSGKSA